MKKRAQLPNAQTYTIIFRGCAQSVHPKTAVGEAMRIYRSMLQENSRIKPNTIHFNAVIDCCARAGDIENMFSIVDTANEGLRSPNNLTFTMILNALHRDVVQPHKANRDSGADPEAQALQETQHQEAIAVAIRRAKLVWEDVIRGWKKGQIIVDEELVCAMGRLLLQGKAEDNRAILDLLEQTMQLPMAIQTRPQLAEAGGSAVGGSGKEGEDEARTKPSPAVAVEPVKAAPSKSLAWARPGRNSLSLVMMTITNLNTTSMGPHYWKLFTKTHGVEPDNDNYNRYLRVLRNGRASGRAAAVMGEIPAKMATEKTFRLAFSTCIHDNLNKNAFSHALAIMSVMSKTLRTPDPRSLRMFLQAATGNFRHFQQQAETDPVGARMALGRQLVVAVDRLWEPFGILNRSFSYPAERSNSPEELWTRQRDQRLESLATARRMMATMDKVVSEHMAEPDVLQIVRTRRNILNRHITRAYDKMNEMDANVDRTAPRRVPRPARDFEDIPTPSWSRSYERRRPFSEPAEE
jgi:pentatricopeptide repeat protein